MRISGLSSSSLAVSSVEKTHVSRDKVVKTVVKLSHDNLPQLDVPWSVVSRRSQLFLFHKSFLLDLVSAFPETLEHFTLPSVIFLACWLN